MYSVEAVEEAVADIEALPAPALTLYAELATVLELTPWSGAAYNRMHPGASMRTSTFGPSSEGLVVYLVLEEQRRVVVLRVLWLA